MTPTTLRSAICAAAIAASALAGCGSSGKPAYCSQRSNLEASIKGLTSLNLDSGLSGLRSQLQTQVKKIQSDAAALVSSAKSDFPNESAALTSSITALKQSVDAIPGHAASKAEVRAIAANAANVVKSVTGFTDATKSKCG